MYVKFQLIQVRRVIFSVLKLEEPLSLWNPLTGGDQNLEDGGGGHHDRSQDGPGVGCSWYWRHSPGFSLSSSSRS